MAGLDFRILVLYFSIKPLSVKTDHYLTLLSAPNRNSNVLILTTSNITGAIDLAFVDRADIKQYIGPPSPRAIYQIFRSCIIELMRVRASRSGVSRIVLRGGSVMYNHPAGGSRDMLP